ncbi:putative phage tail assembly chaperone [Vibrio kanaloae]|uniref:putative phage tail assembly chaperone n=1 Tax=Vibrio kanaloae TaxID=170673 RepID=UPI000989991F|nr:putative phage tail assembly chaperone [Vibrio kanaloae]QPK06498.1 putative phage tail assembly chaperone [Vibrio kanaloae]
MSKIVLTVGETDLEFNPTPAEYDEAQNTTMQGDISSAAHNFLMGCVSEGSKDALREITQQNAGAATQIYGAVLKEYTPKLAISVKK